jgi:hypothetical protein
LTLDLGISSLSELESTLVALVCLLDVNHDAFQPLLKLEDIRLVNCYALAFTLKLGYSGSLLILELANKSSHGMRHKTGD